MKKLLNFFDRLFTKVFNGVRHIIKQYTVPAIEVVQLIKKLMDSGLPARIAEVTNNEWDNYLVARINVFLPKALITLQLVNCSNLADPDEILQCAMDKLKSMDARGRHAAWRDIAILLMEDLADGKLSTAECVHAVQYWYTKYYAVAA